MDTVEFEWVIGRYAPDNKTGQYALSLAEAGQSYHQMNRDRKKTDDIILAFKRAVDYSKPFPEHLAKASPFQIEKLDRLDRKRMGTERH